MRQGRLVAFCGAGLSVLPPSRAPSWWDIYVAVARALSDRLVEAIPQLEPLLDVDALLAPMQTQQLADIVFSRFAGPGFARMLQIVDIADPNENHRALATLAQLGGLRCALTTNFDTLIERAAAIRGVRFAVAAPGMPAEPSADTRPMLVKIHGTAIEPASLIETSAHKAREISPALRAAWLPTLPGADILVLGYSGADLNFGAARLLFEDALSTGARIWWLARPGSPPSLTSAVAARTTLIEGRLPEFLRALIATLGESDYDTPVTGRDAHDAMARGMAQWSRSLHIGPWAAAAFFLALCEHDANTAETAPLREALLDLARRAAERVRDSGSTPIAGFLSGTFLSQAGRVELRHARIDSARGILRLATDVFEAVHAELEIAGHRESHDERRMNLASTWNNYAHACALSGDVGAAVAALENALEHAYLGGRASDFLIALMNLLQYRFELRDVRRCLGIAEGAIAVADRLGAVQSSIELRVIAAMYHCHRSEAWSARALSSRAEELAAALHDPGSRRLATIQRGECELRCGRIEEGLQTISGALSPDSEEVFVSRAALETGRYLRALRIAQPSPFTLRLDASDVSTLGLRIREEQGRARAADAPPFGGAHCAISSSACIAVEDGAALTRIGLADFEGDAGSAIAVGLWLAERLIGRSEARDADWVAANVLARPDLPALDRARAHAVRARCASMVARPGASMRHLEHALAATQEAGIPLPTGLVHLGVWIEVQSGRCGAAESWAAMAAEAAKRDPRQIADLVQLIAQLESWGDETASVVSVLRSALEALGVTYPASSAPDPARRFRFLHPSASPTAASESGVRDRMADAQGALLRGEPERALADLDALEDSALRPPDAGVAMALRVSAMAAARSIDDVDAELQADRGRLLRRFAFGPLSMLESAVILGYVRDGKHAMAAERIERCAWIADLADDPVARAALQAWDALRPWLLGQSFQPAERTLDALRAACLWDLPEAALCREALAPAPGARTSNPSRDVLISLHALLRSSDDASEVDRRMMDAITHLRRMRTLLREDVARLRGERANWALRQQRFDEAVRWYGRAERSFQSLGLTRDRLNASAGMARAFSRSSRYAAATATFEKAIRDVGKDPLRANLLLGLGAAHLLEASRRKGDDARPLRELAVRAFEAAVEAAPARSTDRVHARLALARGLGELGRQPEAMQSYDLAAAELADQGHANAGALLSHRDELVRGNWGVIALG